MRWCSALRENILCKHDTEADVDRLKNWDTEAVPILLFQTPLAFL